MKMMHEGSLKVSNNRLVDSRFDYYQSPISITSSLALKTKIMHNSYFMNFNESNPSLRNRENKNNFTAFHVAQFTSE